MPRVSLTFDENPNGAVGSRASVPSSWSRRRSSKTGASWRSPTTTGTTRC